jgi:hypothetical protein
MKNLLGAIAAAMLLGAGCAHERGTQTQTDMPASPQASVDNNAQGGAGTAGGVDCTVINGGAANTSAVGGSGSQPDQSAIHGSASDVNAPDQSGISGSASDLNLPDQSGIGGSASEAGAVDDTAIDSSTPKTDATDDNSIGSSDTRSDTFEDTGMGGAGGGGG